MRFKKVALLIAIGLLTIICIVLVIDISRTRVAGMKDFPSQIESARLKTRSDDPSERIQGIIFLTCSPHQGVIDIDPAIQALSTDENDMVRSQAAMAILRALMPPEGVSIEQKMKILPALLKSSTEDPDTLIRNFSIRSVWHLLESMNKEANTEQKSKAKEICLPYLEKAASDTSDSIRSIANKCMAILEDTSPNAGKEELE